MKSVFPALVFAHSVLASSDEACAQDESTLLQLGGVRQKLMNKQSTGASTRHIYGDTGNGGNSCPTADVLEADCLAAVQRLLPPGQEQGRTSLVAGSWGWVPPGCSVQSDFTHNQDGDWAAHYNRNPAGNNDGGYTKVCTGDYSYGVHQANTCPDTGVSEAECLGAVQALLPPGQAQGRTHLVAGSWGWVPPGCSVQSDFTHGQDGDWAAHYNRNSGGQNDGGYTPVCSGNPAYHYGSHQTNSCPDADVSESKCLDAVQQLLYPGRVQGRSHLVAGSWGWVPPGCSVQSDFTHNQDGDWAAHYNRGNGQNDGGYTPVCSTTWPDPVLQNGDFEEGFTPQETGNSHTMSGSGYEYTNIFPGWTAAGGTVMVASNNGPWGGIGASSGGHLLALQSASAEIKQTVFNLRVGQLYKVTVNAAQRTNSPGGTNALLKISANGAQLLNKHVTATAMEAQEAYFTASSAIVQLKIENDVDSGDQTVFVDAITLTTADLAGYAAVNVGACRTADGDSGQGQYSRADHAKYASECASECDASSTCVAFEFTGVTTGDTGCELHRQPKPVGTGHPNGLCYNRA